MEKTAFSDSVSFLKGSEKRNGRGNLLEESFPVLEPVRLFLRRKRLTGPKFFRVGGFYPAFSACITRMILPNTIAESC
jgi:hypothetical protein